MRANLREGGFPLLLSLGFLGDKTNWWCRQECAWLSGIVRKVEGVTWRSALYVLIAAERAKVLKEKMLTHTARFRDPFLGSVRQREKTCPLFILMGKKSEKLPKEKIRAEFRECCRLGFLPSERGRNAWCIQEKSWAGATR